MENKNPTWMLHSGSLEKILVETASYSDGYYFLPSVFKIIDGVGVVQANMKDENLPKELKEFVKQHLDGL